MQPLYNREGRAIAYIADNEVSVYLYDGGPAGWIHQGCLYAYSGRFLGWVIYGWLCDPEGYPAFFTDRSQGGPRRPQRQARPLRAPREFRPQRATRWGRPSRPGMKVEWSKHSDESFFASAPGDEIAGGVPVVEAGERAAPMEEAMAETEEPAAGTNDRAPEPELPAAGTEEPSPGTEEVASGTEDPGAGDQPGDASRAPEAAAPGPRREE